MQLEALARLVDVDSLDLLVSPEDLDHREQLDRREGWVSLDLLEQLDSQDHPDLVDYLEALDLEDFPVRSVNKTLLIFSY